MSYKETSAKADLIQRGNKKTNSLGVATFVGLRAIDPLLQYGILARGIGSGVIEKLGGTVLPAGPATFTNTFLDRLRLSPYRLMLLSMATGSMLKQNYTILNVTQEETAPSASIIISIVNTVFNSINNLLFLNAATSASVNGEHFPQTPLLVGSALYVVGILAELVSEAQRKQFKSKAENKGQVYKSGLFGLARHINYGGYTLWRTGFAIAGSGWTWGAATAAFLIYNFTQSSIPLLSHYCKDRYGEQWEDYKRQTPFVLIPYVW